MTVGLGEQCEEQNTIYQPLLFCPEAATVRLHCSGLVPTFRRYGKKPFTYTHSEVDNHLVHLDSCHCQPPCPSVGTSWRSHHSLPLQDSSPQGRQWVLCPLGPCTRFTLQCQPFSSERSQEDQQVLRCFPEDCGHGGLFPQMPLMREGCDSEPERGQQL